MQNRPSGTTPYIIMIWVKMCSETDFILEDFFCYLPLCQQDYTKTAELDFHKTSNEDGSQLRIDPINFWCGS